MFWYPSDIRLLGNISIYTWAVSLYTSPLFTEYLQTGNELAKMTHVEHNKPHYHQFIPKDFVWYKNRGTASLVGWQTL
jgi:hypothetical protein